MAVEKELEQQETEEQETEESKEESAPSSRDSEKTERETMIPRERFDEVNKRVKELEKQQKDREEAARKAEETRLKEQKDFENLAKKQEAELEQLRPKGELLESYEDALRQLLDAQVEELPEQYRDLVPSELPVAKQLEWLANNKAKLTKAVAPDVDAGKRGAVEKVTDLTDEEKEVADSYNMSYEEYAKYKENREAEK